MDKTALFHFQGALNDFLPRQRKLQLIKYRFIVAPALKDAIEALGVPHLAVGRVEVNGETSDLHVKIKDGDQVEVFPKIYSRLPPTSRFVADAHLGKLARELRMLGIDTAYAPPAEQGSLIMIANTEKRMLLTRSVNLLKHGSLNSGYWVRSETPWRQVMEVLSEFGLKGKTIPFSRCLECNGEIAPVLKEEIQNRLQPITKAAFNEFFKCSNCSRIYWKGSHYERMQFFIESISEI